MKKLAVLTDWKNWARFNNRGNKIYFTYISTSITAQVPLERYFVILHSLSERINWYLAHPQKSHVYLKSKINFLTP